MGEIGCFGDTPAILHTENVVVFNVSPDIEQTPITVRKIGTLVPFPALKTLGILVCSAIALSHIELPNEHKSLKSAIFSDPRTVSNALLLRKLRGSRVGCSNTLAVSFLVFARAKTLLLET